MPGAQPESAGDRKVIFARQFGRKVDKLVKEYMEENAPGKYQATGWQAAACVALAAMLLHRANRLWPTPALQQLIEYLQHSDLIGQQLDGAQPEPGAGQVRTKGIHLPDGRIV